MLQKRLAALQRMSSHALSDGRLLGVEKECLRVRSDGGIAQTEHPQSFGAALTNPHITTDYSEALLEIVTPPLQDTASVMRFLSNAHRFIYPRLSEAETLWATSMPCILQGAENIPVGFYGNSNAGLMKQVYRKGLGLRYGKAMQTIAGVHFNFSWPQAFWEEWQDLQLQTQQRSPNRGASAQSFVTAEYFHMTRNLLRFGWLVPYLFGSSPAVCRTFLDGSDRLPGMKVYNDTTYYEPFGTSLRMGDIGYQYRKDSSSPINVSYAGVDDYVRDLLQLISAPNSRYAEIGLHDELGRFQQLNINRLQIENEYYSSVRPKQIPKNGEMPLAAMARGGIRYLELRSVDVNVFEPLGVEANQLYFLEVFMLFSLLHDSPQFCAEDMSVISDNMTNTAHGGRNPQLSLVTPCGQQKERKLRAWGAELLEQMLGPAEILDQHTGTTHYTRALALQQVSMADPEATPSARVLREMTSKHASFFDFAQSWSLQHAETLQQAGYELGENGDSAASDSFDEQYFLDQARTSHIAARNLLAESTGSLEQYLAKYFEQLSDDTLARYRVA